MNNLIVMQIILTVTALGTLLIFFIKKLPYLDSPIEKSLLKNLTLKIIILTVLIWIVPIPFIIFM